MSVFTSLVVRTLPLMPKALVWRVARRYVAGPTLADAVATVRRLNGEGTLATVDVLGEEVSERRKAEAAVDDYLRVLAAIAAEKLDANVSLKPTMFGLKVDEGFCREQIERLVAAAHAQGTFVRIDMEDRTTTDATLRIYRHLHERYGNVGVVLQAYMRRTLRDVEELPKSGARSEWPVNVRICKGIYVEPREVAWKGFDTVREAFVAALDKLLSSGVYVGIATHDEYLVSAAVALLERGARVSFATHDAGLARGLSAMVGELGVPRERYEFQVLLGVQEPLWSEWQRAGHTVRVYVPFGPEWQPYSLRRLRKNPEILRHVVRATLGLG